MLGPCKKGRAGCDGVYAHIVWGSGRCNLTGRANVRSYRRSAATPRCKFSHAPSATTNPSIGQRGDCPRPPRRPCAWTRSHARSLLAKRSVAARWSAVKPTHASPYFACNCVPNHGCIARLARDLSAFNATMMRILYKSVFKSSEQETAVVRLGGHITLSASLTL